MVIVFVCPDKGIVVFGGVLYKVAGVKSHVLLRVSGIYTVRFLSETCMWRMYTLAAVNVYVWL